LVVLYFRSGSRIEAAYGLAITVTMLMTTALLSIYLWKVRGKAYLALPVFLIFGAIESVFFVSSLGKFTSGGYVTVLIALLIFLVMYVWYRGTDIEKTYSKRLDLKDYVEEIGQLRSDDSIPYVADNIVFVENDMGDGLMDRDILYSIMDKTYKRAKAYWFISVHSVEDPDTLTYKVENYGTDYIFRITIDVGFKREPLVNVYLRQITTALLKSGELPPQEKKYSIYSGTLDIGTFKFVMIKKVVPSNGSFAGMDGFIMKTKYAIRTHAGSREEWYGLDTSSIIEERVPIIIADSASVPEELRLRRIIDMKK
jgi:KUP system potassium uptake protein